MAVSIKDAFWDFVLCSTSLNQHFGEPLTPCNAEVNYSGAIPPLSHIPLLHGASLFRHKENVAFKVYVT
jgi:hypothetical protein